MRSFFVASLIYWVTLSITLLNYGSVELLTVTLLAVPIFLLLIALLVTVGLPKYTGSTLWMTAILMVLLFTWIAVQTTLDVSLPFSEPAWEEIRGFLPDAPTRISQSPEDDRAAALRIAVPFGVFMVGLLLFSTDERATRALNILSVLAGLISVFSIAQFYIAPDRLLFDAKKAYLSSLTGIFVNRNTAATFFGLGLLLNFSLVETFLRKMNFRDLLAVIAEGTALSPVIEKKLWYAALHFALLCSTLTALMLTKSRGGIGAAFIAVCFLLLLKAFRTSNKPSERPTTARRRPWVRLIVGAGICSAIFLIFFSLGQRVLLRTQIQDTFEDGRFCVMPSILSAVREHFLLGTGLTGFSAIFPAYRDPVCGIIGAWDRAHNVYLEGVLTLGIVFIVSALIVSLWLTIVFVIGLIRRRSARFAGELGLSSLLMVGIHSAIDFSLQISGLAIFFAAMLGPIVTLSLRPPGNKRSKSISVAAPSIQISNK